MAENEEMEELDPQNEVPVEDEPRNGATPPQPQTTQVKVTKQYLESVPLPAARRQFPHHVKAPTIKEQTDRDYLNELAATGKSSWQLCITRTGPARNKSGEALPIGSHSRYCVGLMTFDNMKASARETWGSGNFRANVVDEREADIPNTRGILFEIPISECPPFIEKGRMPEDILATPAPAQGEESELQRMKREAEMRRQEAAIEETNAKTEIARRTAQLKQLTAEKELSKLTAMAMRNSEDDTAKVELRMQASLSEMRRENDVRTSKLENMIERMMDKLSTPPPAPPPPPPVDYRALAEIFAPVLVALKPIPPPPAPPPPPPTDWAPLATALAPVLVKLVEPKPPDNSMAQAITTMAAGQERLAAAITAKPPDNGNKEVMEMIKMSMDNQTRLAMRESKDETKLTTTLLNTLLGRKNEAFGPDQVIKFMQLGREMAMGGSQESSDPQSDYDPKLGIAGNLVKGLYDSLKGLTGMAMQNPQLLQAVTQLFGTKTPTDQQLWERAQLGVMNGVLPGVGMQTQLPLQQQQLPLGGYEPIGNVSPMMTSPPVMIPPTQTQQWVPSPQQGAPSVQTPPSPPVAAIQQQLANQLEGEATGEVIIDTPEQRLSGYVTETIAHANSQITDKIAQRDWPMHATDTWPENFKRAIVQQDNPNVQLNLIHNVCNPVVWHAFSTAVQGSQEELGLFWRGMHEFVQANIGLRAAPKPVPVQVAQAGAAPAPAAPQQQPPATAGGQANQSGPPGVAGTPGTPIQ